MEREDHHKANAKKSSVENCIKPCKGEYIKSSLLELFKLVLDIVHVHFKNFLMSKWLCSLAWSKEETWFILPYAAAPAHLIQEQSLYQFHVQVIPELS